MHPNGWQHKQFSVRKVKCNLRIIFPSLLLWSPYRRLRSMAWLVQPKSATEATTTTKNFAIFNSKLFQCLKKVFVRPFKPTVGCQWFCRFPTSCQGKEWEGEKKLFCLNFFFGSRTNWKSKTFALNWSQTNESLSWPCSLHSLLLLKHSQHTENLRK